jgi:rfaE bifunctional protein kinase chain/domain
VVGDLVADHYVYGQTDRVSREAPVLIVRYESSEVKLGGAGNVAANLRSLGGQVVLVGVLGKDEMGEALERCCSDVGIGLRGLKNAALKTETKMRVLAGGLNTRRQQMLRVDRGNPVPLPVEVRRELAEGVREEAKQARLIVVSDYGAGTVGEEVRDVLAGLGRDGMPICVDSRHSLKGFRGATVCKPNEPELEALTGMTLRSEDDLRKAGRLALQMLPGASLLVTRGHLGMALFPTSGEVQWIAAHGGKEAVDVTGAGDTVLATLALSLNAGASLLEAARLANVAGALVVEKPGTATVTQEDLLRELRGAE